MQNKLLVFGGLSTAIEIFEVVEKYFVNNFDEIFFVIADTDEKTTSNQIHDSEVSGLVNSHFKYIISFSNHQLRLKIEKLMNSLRVLSVNIIHPKAEISPTAKIGSGNYIAANSVVSSNVKIGDNNLINFNVVIGHDSVIEDHVIINPGVSLGGNCHISKRVLIGANSFIFQGKKIGEDSIVDAMTYVERDIESGVICTNRDYDNLKILKRRI